MKTIAFILTMPNRGSWNGQWSGQGNLYAIVKNFTDKSAAKHKFKPSYYYHWNDGWGASVQVRQVDKQEARLLRKNTKGFCGYDWMVESIINHNAIYADHEIPTLS